VLEPLVTRVVEMKGLEGQLLGPGDTPLTNATIEIPSMNLRVHTDAHGRFHFHAVPAASLTQRLRIYAKGQTFDVEVDPQRTPLTVRIDFPDMIQSSPDMS
jgi:hypothetical protein